MVIYALAESLILNLHSQPPTNVHVFMLVCLYSEFKFGNTSLKDIYGHDWFREKIEPGLYQPARPLPTRFLSCKSNFVRLIIWVGTGQRDVLFSWTGELALQREKCLQEHAQRAPQARLAGNEIRCRFSAARLGGLVCTHRPRLKPPSS